MAKVVRLTESMRNSIIVEVISKTFEERVADIGSRSSAAARRAYEFVVTEQQRDLMSKLPKEFFYLRNSFAVSDGKDNINVRLYSAEGIRVPAIYQYGEFIIQSTHGFWKEFRAIKAEANAIDEEKDVLRRTLHGVLVSCKTTRQLLEVWPDAEKYLQKEEESKLLPAIRSEDLNSMISKFAKK